MVLYIVPLLATVLVQDRKLAYVDRFVLLSSDGNWLVEFIGSYIVL